MFPLVYRHIRNRLVEARKKTASVNRISEKTFPPQIIAKSVAAADSS